MLYLTVGLLLYVWIPAKNKWWWEWRWKHQISENTKAKKLAGSKKGAGTLSLTYCTYNHVYATMLLQYVWPLVQIAWSTRRRCCGTLHCLSSFIFSSVSKLSSFKHPRVLLAHLTAVSTPPSIHSSLSPFVLVHMSLPIFVLISPPTDTHLCVPQSALHHLISPQRDHCLSISSFSGAEFDRLVWQQGPLLSANLHGFICLVASNAADLKGGTNIYRVIL